MLADDQGEHESKPLKYMEWWCYISYIWANKNKSMYSSFAFQWGYFNVIHLVILNEIHGKTDVSSSENTGVLLVGLLVI